MKRVTLCLGILMALLVSIVSSASPWAAPVARGFSSEEADPAPPPITADNAIVVARDPFRVLWHKSGYTRADPFSTTKMMTALLAIEREGDRLDRTVRVGYYPTTKSGSLMKDSSGQRLEEGERLTLRSLLYGLMLPSGNDAAQVIAEYLADCEGRGYSRTSAEGRECEEEFAELMNERAQQLGLDNTSFRNPHGWVVDGHYSTAYDLAKLADYALRNPLFASIVQTHTKTVFSTLGGATKRYDLHNTNRLLHEDYYPGVVGVKTGTWGNGSRQNLVSSATLAGQSVIVVVMDSDDRYEDSRKLLDYAFDRLLTVERLGDSGSQAGAISQVAAASRVGDNVVTAVRDGEGELKLISWHAGADGTITRTGDSGSQAGEVTEVTAANIGGNLVTAVRDSAGRLKLITWAIGASLAKGSVSITRLGDSGGSGPLGSQVSMKVLSASRLVTGMRTPAGFLKLIVWRLDPDGSWTQMGESSPGTGDTADEVAVAAFSTNGGPDGGAPTSFRVLTAVRDAGANLRLKAWDVEAGGTITQISSYLLASGSRILQGAPRDLALYYGPWGLFTTAMRDGAGDLKLVTWSLSASGAITLLSDSGAQAGDASEISLSGLSDRGVVTAVRTGTGDLKLIAWALTQDGKVKRLDDSGAQAGAVDRIAMVQQLNGRYVAAIRTAAGDLKLVSWRIIPSS
ncbi:MAG: hypothetical protein HYX95_01425 [Chloroflexi bacterium]|nr:hypothetical protein [Chloroflexota bacterium]